MATKEELDAAVANIQQAIATLATDLSAAIKALQDKISSGGDFTAEVAALSTINDSVQAMDAQAKAVTAPPTPPTGA